MREIQKILFPADLSETSSKIVPYVKIMAEKFNAQIYLLFIVRSLENFVGFYVPHPSINQFESQISQGAKRRLKEFADKYFSPDNVAKSDVKIGDAAEEILNYIETEGINLILMGTHGRKGLDKVLFGSVADRVSKLATVPVLLINVYRIPGLKESKESND